MGPCRYAVTAYAFPQCIPESERLPPFKPKLWHRLLRPSTGAQTARPPRRTGNAPAHGERDDDNLPSLALGDQGLPIRLIIIIITTLIVTPELARFSQLLPGRKLRLVLVLLFLVRALAGPRDAVYHRARRADRDLLHSPGSHQPLGVRPALLREGPRARGEGVQAAVQARPFFVRGPARGLLGRQSEGARVRRRKTGGAEAR